MYHNTNIDSSKAEGITTDSNFFSTSIIAYYITAILSLRDSRLVENLNNQQITQEAFDIAGDEIADELQELETAEAIIML